MTGGRSRDEVPKAPLIPSRAADDSDEGWGDGDGSATAYSDAWYEEQRPPHW